MGSDWEVVLKAPAVGGRKSKKKPDEVPGPDVPLSPAERAAAQPLEPSGPEDGDEDERDEGQREEGDTDEGAPDFSAGVGVGAGRPDLDRLDPRDKKRPRDSGEPLDGDERFEQDVDMRPTEFAAGRPTEGPLGGDNDDLDDLGRALSKFGTRGRFRVRRLFPDDMPPNEMAIGPWIPIPGEAPSRDQVYDAITRRYGGGRYEVRIGDMNEGEFHKSMLIPIDVAGDPIPQTAYGRIWYQQRFGVPAPIPAGGMIAPGSSPSASGVPGSSDGVMLALMQMLSSDKEREARMRGEDKDREVSLATAVLSRQGGGLASLAPLFPIALEMWKASREDARRREEKHDAMMLKLMGDGKPQIDPMVAFAPVMNMTQKRLELEMSTYAKHSDLMMKQILGAKDDGGEDSSLLGTVLSVVREAGPDFLRSVGPAIAAAVTRGNLQQMVQTDPRMAQVRQRLAQPAARPAGALPPPPQPRAAAPGAPPPPAAPAVGSEPPPAGGAVPEPPPLPPEAGGGQPGPQLPPPAPEPQAPRALPRPGQMAVEISNQALHQFLFYLRGFAETGPDPIDFWDTNFDGQTVQTLFGLCPVWFRKRMEAVNVKAPFSMVEIGAGGPENVVEICHEFDAFLEGNAASREWLGEFLEAGPWNEEPDDDED